MKIVGDFPQGAIPATVAVKDGVCCIGLSIEELQDLAKAGGEKRAQKCSTRELPLIMAKHRSVEGRHAMPHKWGGKKPSSV
jgi:pseudouridine-5'-phosphate glycosidase